MSDLEAEVKLHQLVGRCLKKRAEARRDRIGVEIHDGRIAVKGYWDGDKWVMVVHSIVNEYLPKEGEKSEA
jgi:hypothetical protein